MFKKLLLTITLSFSLTAAAAAAAGQEIKPASEDEQYLLDKSEIVELIQKAVKITSQKRKEIIDRVWAEDKGSTTPRSDFLYSTAFAYLNDPKAQACLARAFENGTGIVSDLTDAYVWYTIALEAADDTDLKKSLQAGQTRVKTTLVSVYPAPSDYELEDAVKQKKEKIEEYAAEAAVTGH